MSVRSALAHVRLMTERKETQRHETELCERGCSVASGPALSGWGRATLLAATTPFGLAFVMTPWPLPLLHMTLGLTLLLLVLALAARSSAVTPAGGVCMMLNTAYLILNVHVLIFPQALRGAALVLALLPIAMHVNAVLLTGMGSLYANLTLFSLSSAPFLLFMIAPAADAQWTPIKAIAIVLMGAALAELFLAAASRQAGGACAGDGAGPCGRHLSAKRLAPEAGPASGADLAPALDGGPAAVQAPSVTQGGAVVDGLSVDMRVGTAGAQAGMAEHCWRPGMARMNRLLLLEALSVTMAHEISQPVNAAAIFIGATQRWLDQPRPNVREASGAATQAAAQLERARAIISRIRRCAGSDDVEAVRVDVNQAIAEVLLLVQHAYAARGVSLRFHPCHGRAVMVTVIQCELEQILANLLLNSLQAIPTAAQRACVRIAVRMGAGRVAVWVIDDGQGLPAAPPEQLFDRFMTTKPLGTGLGLPISRQLAEKAGGRLTLHCRRRVAGAVAILDLPVATQV